MKKKIYKITESQFYRLVMNEEVEEVKPGEIAESGKNEPFDKVVENKDEPFNKVVEGENEPFDKKVTEDKNEPFGKKVVENENEPFDKVVEDDNGDKSSADIMESIKKTQGGLQLRKLLKEETSIKGEYKSAYGKWHQSEWNLDGTPVTSANEYNKYIMTIDLPK